MSFKEKTRYRVMWINEDLGGVGEMNSDGFYTEDEAQQQADELKEMFPEEDYYVQQYTFKEYVNDNNGGISGGVDGWEDIHPEYEYESGDYGWN